MAMVSPELLRRYAVFAGANDEALRKVAMISEEREVATGETLFDEGDTAQALFLLVEGEVDLQATLGEGSRRTVDTAVAGDLLGWSALVEPYRMHLSAVARRGSRLIRVDAKGLRELRLADPVFGLALMQSVAEALSHRLEGAQVQLASAG